MKLALLLLAPLALPILFAAGEPVAAQQQPASRSAQKGVAWSKWLPTFIVTSGVSALGIAL
jgi:hypothetical protein